MNTFLPLISLITAVLLVVKMKYNHLPFAQQIPTEYVDKMKLGLIGIWSISIVFLTTSTDYLFLSTGYVSIWIAFLCSLNLAAYSNEQVRQVEQTALRFQAKSYPLFGISILSTIMFTSSVFSCLFMPTESEMCNSNAILSMILALISTTSCVWLLTSEYTDKTVQVNDTGANNATLYQASTVLLLLWIFVVAFCTTRLPYYNRTSGSVVANMFIPSWSCLLLSVYFHQSQQDNSQVNNGENEETIYV